MLMKYYLLRALWVSIIVLSVLLRAPTLLYASQSSPFANTKNPTYITEKSAQLNGAVNPSEMPDTYQWFEWGVVGNYNTVYETPHYAAGAGSQMIDTSSSLIGLAPERQYFYRQIAENSRGKDIGQTTYFTTKPLPNAVSPIIIVQTNNADTITDTTANLKGYLSPHGGNATKWWFEWGLTIKLENATPHAGWGGDSGSTQTTIVGLTPGTTYFYRVVGENSQGVVYGVTKAFITTGPPPPPPEAPRAGGAPQPQAQGDGVSRKITNSGATAPNGGMPGSTNGNLPGDIFGFGALFGKKPNTTATTNTSAAGTASTQQGNAAANTSSANQAAVAGASSPIGTFWNTLTGKKVVEVSIEKIGPSKVPVHTAVEYRVAYAYRLKSPATNAKLKIVLPADVVYIGDNTINELLLEEGAGPERTYDLPLGQIENGSTRTISILGMTTGDANGTFPDARARIEYVDASGATVVVSAGAGVSATSKEAASVGGSSSLFLPSSFIGWLLYIFFIAAAIIGVRKAMAYYEVRKQELEAEKANAGRAEVSTFPATQVPV